MNKINYGKETEKIIENLSTNGKIPKLLLHSCCAPCSSYVLEYLREYFDITVFYYNPNISNDKEYQKRLQEEIRLIQCYNEQVENQSFEGMHSSGHAHRISIMESPYDSGVFFESVKGLENCREGGERCFVCYELRLRETAKRAEANHFDYFTTTLTISPLKNAQKLNEIGLKLAEEYHTAWLPSDFKKKDGFKRSIELSRKFDLYRQNYCGCVFSRRDTSDTSENIKS